VAKLIEVLEWAKTADLYLPINLYRKHMSKHPRCGVPGVVPNAPEPGEVPSGMRGNRYEAMTIKQHKLT
jgi:hypothetical protein